uniref:Uncharacterized protein n=1 Tax=Chromera velia CCMP2878 TaxID=1169474 RepID=A0A0G4HDD7_9ALVE|eukprot:Cvel_26493.t1-p1 / transcript=Cvel_26493.t1 / gene=Cvel_26493 / organism=Chromera_velia_CCMP2878 / gene_product=hypothetical protein / transcript_product=hypothetical protein / location=Cvel_scaffold3158:15317-17286(-) / protein_length=92 / sequence_SO=supercontig / SO=protein_coding / is_pseudo=false
MQTFGSGAETPSVESVGGRAGGQAGGQGGPRASSFTDEKAILTVAIKIAEVTEPQTTPSDFVDIIKNITQLEAAFTEEAIIRMNQNFMETLI